MAVGPRSIPATIVADRDPYLPDFCKEIGGALTVPADYLAGRLSRLEASRTLGMHVRLTLVYQSARDPGFDPAGSVIYEKTARDALNHYLTVEQPPYDATVLAGCILWYFVDADLPTPGAVVVTGDVAASWTGSEYGEVCSVRTCDTQFQLTMRVIILLPRPVPGPRQALRCCSAACLREKGLRLRIRRLRSNYMS